MHLSRAGTVVLLAIKSHPYTTGLRRTACWFHRYSQVCSSEGRWSSL
jgi:hypothetical protein